MNSVHAYIELTKPRIIGLLLVTTVPSMMLAKQGMPSGWLILATLIGGYLTAGSANAFNQYFDRDIDRVMARTKSRPLPTGRLSVLQVLSFATLIGLVGVAWLMFTVNGLAALLAAIAVGFYVVVYTLILKRNTAQNIVIGGAAGAVPALIGWAAVAGDLAMPAWVLFAIIFVWTPPHFWALAVKYRDEYASVNVPMMPVKVGFERTATQVVAYSFVLVATSLLLVTAEEIGWIYAVSALLLGANFVRLAFKLKANPTVAEAMSLFKFSIIYLAGVFAAVGVDSLL